MRFRLPGFGFGAQGVEFKGIRCLGFSWTSKADKRNNVSKQLKTSSRPLFDILWAVQVRLYIAPV